jgi:hypothetical protein
VTFLSILSNGNRTLTVSLPKPQTTSFIKKSELLSKDLPKSMVQEVSEGQVLELVRPAASVDATYFLIELAPSPLRRLVDATRDAYAVDRGGDTKDFAPRTVGIGASTFSPEFGITVPTNHLAGARGGVGGSTSGGGGGAERQLPSDPSPGLKPGAPPGWIYAAHVAEQVLEEMVAEANITVVRSLGGIVGAAPFRCAPYMLMCRAHVHSL